VLLSFVAMWLHMVQYVLCNCVPYVSASCLAVQPTQLYIQYGMCQP
jgi:hypothetical protein